LERRSSIRLTGFTVSPHPNFGLTAFYTTSGKETRLTHFAIFLFFPVHRCSSSDLLHRNNEEANRLTSRTKASRSPNPTRTPRSNPTPIPKLILNRSLRYDLLGNIKRSKPWRPFRKTLLLAKHSEAGRKRKRTRKRRKRRKR
jgi:hypothetical protein